MAKAIRPPHRYVEPPQGFDSWATWLALQPASTRKAFLDSLKPGDAEKLEHLWWFWARKQQLPPAGKWFIWLLLSGRGAGKTRSGSEWVIDGAIRGFSQRMGIALVGATVDDARDIIIEGESGILNKAPPWFMPEWTGSNRLLRFPNGEWARTYSADRPERLRGKQHSKAWADEVGSWRYAETWDQLMFGLRLGDDPQVCVTTTPRPTPIIRQLAKDAAETKSLVRESTFANRKNLAKATLEVFRKKYEGTRLGRQELEAEILDDNPGALWSRKRIEDQRIKLADVVDEKNKPLGPAALCDRLGITKLVVAVDPSVTSNPESSNECGIVVVGTASRERGYLLDDVSGVMSPNDWAGQILKVYKKWQCDAIVAEVNNGGDLVEHTLRTFRTGAKDHKQTFKFHKVHASRGKRTRAEPIAALDEQLRMAHVGSFPVLEDQLCDWDPVLSKESPDRLDAYVWGFTFLMVGDPPPPRTEVPQELSRVLY